MRHGPAEDDAPSGRDFDRRLTARGRERTERVARALSARASVVPRIYCSPLVRTVQTAEVVAEVFASTRALDIANELAPGGDASQLVMRSVSLGEPALLIGHEPDVSGLTARLCPTWSAHYDKAMVVALTVDVDVDDAASLSATIDFTIDPKYPHN